MKFLSILEKPVEYTDGLMERLSGKPGYKGITSMLKILGFREERNGTAVFYSNGSRSFRLGDNVSHIFGDDSIDMGYKDALGIIREYKVLRDLLEKKGFSQIEGEGEVYRRRNFTIKLNKEPDSVRILFGKPYPFPSEEDMEFHFEAGLERDRFEGSPELTPFSSDQDYEMTINMLSDL